MATPKPWTRIFRFRLRTLLLLVLAAGVFLGLYVRSVKRQQASVAAIKRLGGWAYYDYEVLQGKHDPERRSPVPKWLLSQLGDDYFHDVVQVNMVYSEQGGQRSDNHQDTDEALRHLDSLPDLQMVLLHKNQASDEGLQHVGRLRQLRKLYIWDGARVTDAGVRHLDGLKNLEYLHLSNAKIGDGSLAVLATLPKLTGMSLQGNDFSDEGLKHLQEMRTLKTLWVGMGPNHITSDGLAHLKGLDRLEELDLQSSQVTNDGLKHLMGLTQLKSIYLHGTQVTDASELRSALPNCHVDAPR